MLSKFIAWLNPDWPWQPEIPSQMACGSAEEGPSRVLTLFIAVHEIYLVLVHLFALCQAFSIKRENLFMLTFQIFLRGWTGGSNASEVDWGLFEASKGQRKAHLKPRIMRNNAILPLLSLKKILVFIFFTGNMEEKEQIMERCFFLTTRLFIVMKLILLAKMFTQVMYG